MGFVGSNLAHQLVALGAHVLIVDSMIPDYGGNPFNVSGLEDKLRINIADVRQRSTMNHLVQQVEVIFNLAGQVSHIDSMQDPDTDLDINCRAQLSLLEACRRHNPGVKVVFAGTRQVYGRPDSLPVSEQHLVRPTDVNGINKAAGENYHLVYNNVFGVRACSLRLTNVYGPRQLLKHNRQGFIGWFIRLAIEGRADPDLRRRVADARLRVRGRRGRRVPARRRQRSLQRPACSTSAAPSRSRTGRSSSCSIGIAGSGTLPLVEWPAEKKAIDIGDFYADSSRIAADRRAGGRRRPWREGLAATLAFYRAHFEHYVPAASQVGAR